MKWKNWGLCIQFILLRGGRGVLFNPRSTDGSRQTSVNWSQPKSLHHFKRKTSRKVFHLCLQGSLKTKSFLANIITIFSWYYNYFRLKIYIFYHYSHIFGRKWSFFLVVYIFVIIIFKVILLALFFPTHLWIQKFRILIEVYIIMKNYIVRKSHDISHIIFILSI